MRQLQEAGPLLPNADSLGERLAFDWRQVQARRQNNDWVLASGSFILANFGTNETEARKALVDLIKAKDGAGKTAKFAKLREGLRTKILGILTEAQQTKLRELVGPPLMGEIVFEEPE